MAPLWGTPKDLRTNKVEAPQAKRQKLGEKIGSEHSRIK